MNEIQRTVEYYQLLIDKFQKTGLSPEQLRIYKEIKELVEGCSSYDEIQSRMKNEGYWESPGQALYLDRMMAQKKAARENGFTELEALYQSRYDEVKADASKMHDAGYSSKAMSILAHYSNIMDTMFGIYTEYCYHNSANVYDDLSYRGSLNNIREKFSLLKSMGTSFREVSVNSYYREHIDLSDSEYQLFLTTVESLLNKHEPDRSEVEPFEETYKVAWGKLKDKKAEVQRIGELEDARTIKSFYLAVPPPDKNGSYELINNEQEEF
ncbi:MAG: hypothetical protein U9P42_02820 [Candidatus Fermentibacteria bacterium]|nr:hypothetical protein [Candidatus Fermentibacteria bacterium]